MADQHADSSDVPPPPRPVILFDGVCSVCDSAVHFILDRDPKRRFVFASLQSPAGQALAARAGVEINFETMMVIEGDRVFTRSAAALRVARGLAWPWPLFYGLILLPRGLRDLGYRYFAANRYRWFGKLDTCRVPTPELRERLLDLQPVQPTASR